MWNHEQMCSCENVANICLYFGYDTHFIVTITWFFFLWSRVSTGSPGWLWSLIFLSSASVLPFCLALLPCLNDYDQCEILWKHSKNKVFKKSHFPLVLWCCHKGHKCKYESLCFIDSVESTPCISERLCVCPKICFHAFWVPLEYHHHLKVDHIHTA